MKHKIILILSVLVLFLSCKDKTPSEPESNPPVLVSSTPANNAVDISAQDFTINLVFDVNVTCPKAGQSKITLNDATIGAVTANMKNVTIAVSGLTKEKTYTLIVPENVILSPAKVGNKEIKITFTTEKKPITGEISATLCTENPSAEATNLYNFLKTNFGNHIISGAMANVNWNTNEANLVYNWTGKYPAITTVDYIHLYASPANWIDYSDISFLENWWKNNGIVSAGWHWTVPVSEGASTYTYEPTKTTFKASNILINGTWEKTQADADLEKIANYLLLLKNKNIPVIWRPLHEAAGNIYAYTGGTAWFWWGANGANTYKQLWIYMFNYFKSKGLNNLIWVWTTQSGDEDFYPGDTYVDIIGRDIYTQNADYCLAQFKTMRTNHPNKLTTLSECGSVATIPAQWEAGAKWSYFMPWYQYNATVANSLDHQYANKAWWESAVNSEIVITRDKMPSLK